MAGASFLPKNTPASAALSMSTPPTQSPPGEKLDVHLSGVQQTVLVPLYCRALDAGDADPVLGDRWAQPTCDRINFDFPSFGLKPDRVAGVALRGRILDQWTSDFVTRHEARPVTVLHLACGLDSRCLRVRRGTHVRWIDVDLPDVVALRRQLMSPPDGDYTLLSGSVTEDALWRDIPADRPTLVVMEGLVMYLRQAEGEALIRRLADHLPSGELAFDALGWLFVSIQKWMVFLQATGAQFQWAIDDPVAVAGLHEKLKLKDSVSRMVDEFPEHVRKKAAVIAAIPVVRDASKMLRFEF
jgi:O-methyltransferase involved in polyketide biosynthesis